MGLLQIHYCLPWFIYDALHLLTSAQKRFLSLPALQGLGHSEEEGWVQEEQPSTLMVLQPDCPGVHWDTGPEAGSSHRESKLWWGPAAVHRSGKIKSSIKVGQVVLVDYDQKWLELLSWSSAPRDHELCSHGLPHAGLQHLKAHCALDWKFDNNVFFLFLKHSTQFVFTQVLEM